MNNTNTTFYDQSKKRKFGEFRPITIPNDTAIAISDLNQQDPIFKLLQAQKNIAKKKKKQRGRRGQRDLVSEQLGLGGGDAIGGGDGGGRGGCGGEEEEDPLDFHWQSSTWTGPFCFISFLLLVDRTSVLSYIGSGLFV